MNVNEREEVSVTNPLLSAREVSLTDEEVHPSVDEAEVFSHSRWRGGRSYYAVALIVITAVLGISVFSVSTYLFVCTGGKIPQDYGIVIDAGSTHTSVYVYHWYGLKDSGTGKVSEKDVCTYEHGIANLHDPTAIITCVNNMTEIIPNTAKSHTPLTLGATAGMRLLNLSNPQEAYLRLLVLKYALMQTGVDVQSVEIISGQSEGLAAWITVNYLSNNFASERAIGDDCVPPSDTHGALDLGGASTQIAYATGLENVTEYSSIKLYGCKYKVVSHSSLCFGFTMAFKRHQALLVQDLNSTETIIDPCLPEGTFSSSIAYDLLGGPCTITEVFEQWLESPEHKNRNFTFKGSGNFEQCKKRVEVLFNFTDCEMHFKECPYRINIVETPVEFMAFSGFYYISSALNATNVTLPEFSARVKYWCNLTWTEMPLHIPKHSNNVHPMRYCFGGIYIIKWLTDIYGFNETTWQRIVFKQKIGKSEIGWSMGYMLNSTNTIPDEHPSNPVISNFAYFALLLSSAVFLVIAGLFLNRYCKNIHYNT